MLNISRSLALEENFVEFSDYAKTGGVGGTHTEYLIQENDSSKARDETKI